jgi:hypothetical protein
VRGLRHDDEVVAVLGESVREPGDDGLSGFVLDGRFDVGDEAALAACCVRRGGDAACGGLLECAVRERFRGPARTWRR